MRPEMKASWVSLPPGSAKATPSWLRAGFGLRRRPLGNLRVSCSRDSALPRARGHQQSPVPHGQPHAAGTPSRGWRLGQGEEARQPVKAACGSGIPLAADNPRRCAKRPGRFIACSVVGRGSMEAIERDRQAACWQSASACVPGYDLWAPTLPATVQGVPDPP